jgi:tetratricopeptide (TPR) repeat protein
MDWARMLAYVTGTVDQELLARNEYLAAENRILKAQLMGRLKLSDAERSVLGEISHRLGRKVLAASAFMLGVPGDDMETGLALVEKAIGLNRNNAEAFRAGAVLYAFKGEIDRAVEHQQQAERLNPLDASWNGNMIYPIAYFGVGDHEKVVDWTARILRERPNVVAALRYRAASLLFLAAQTRRGRSSPDCSSMRRATPFPRCVGTMSSA